MKTGIAAIDTHIPKAPRRDANKPPWVNKELAKAINKNKTPWRRIRKSKNAQMLEKFRKLRQSIKNWICHERQACLREIANGAFTNPKRFWSYFKFKNKKIPIPESVTLALFRLGGPLTAARTLNSSQFQTI